MRELQADVMAIRMQPVQSVFARIPRLVREVSRELGKSVTLVIEGEATEIDKTVIEKLADPLTHLIRNAIDHGIEPPDERRALDKPETATIHLMAAHRSGRITVEIIDDGRGIDHDKVLQKATAQGLVAVGASPANDEVLDLIFAPGFSTAQEVTNVSGRGVGLDVVRRTIQEIGGRVVVESEAGRGTRFLLSLPLTLAVMDGMVVRVGSEQYVLPLGCIIESVRPDEDGISMIAEREMLVPFREDYVPLMPLYRLFGIAGAVEDPRRGLVVFVETDTGAVVGLIVDELVGQRQVVIKSLDENFRAIDGISAATILGDGQVALILEVNSLHGMYRALDRDPGTDPGRMTIASNEGLAT
ncbi:MAG: chemotaxis protein CheA [Alphaproteobacteria bacterium]|jgi:two-component system chemotaxis sensor kinase CheA|nr:chemotaxis protein CheA [Alphaproteobacteria bacterium]